MATTVSSLFDYPVTISAEEFDNVTGRDLSEDIEGDEGKKVVSFLNTLHSHVYDFLIYNTGSRSVKNRIIKEYGADIEKPLKRALIAQGEYLLENGSVGMWNGIVVTVNGADMKATQDIVQKILCPEVFNILMATEPNILYAGV